LPGSISTQCTSVPIGMLRSGSVLRADRDALRRDHIAALTVLVEQEREVRAAVRVVLDALDDRRNAVLLPPPVNHAVMVLVPAALVPHGDRAVVVAAVHLRLLPRQRPERIPLVQPGRDDLHQGTAARGGRFDFDEWHR
jgi:hypothetical protein